MGTQLIVAGVNLEGGLFWIHPVAYAQAHEALACCFRDF